mmetsp:Transcript_17497/g.45739  ORF Transcript_17497/g.45739 Transcript_17497/m.45739 type:complete len:350 (+) Transcript_17497:1913-2962(+)
MQLGHEIFQGLTELFPKRDQRQLALLDFRLARFPFEEVFRERIFRSLHETMEIMRESVVVLVHKFARGVAHGTRKVANHEALVVEHLLVVCHLRLTRRLQTEVFGEGLVHFVSEVRVRGSWALGLIVEDVHDAAFALNHLNDILVVHVFHLFELDALLDIKLLLVLEDALIEELLQLLVTKVDGELLERVDLKVLETCDIKDPNIVHGTVLRVREALVRAPYDPVEQLRVQCLRQRISAKLGLHWRETLVAILPGDRDGLETHGFLDGPRLKAKHLRDALKRTFRRVRDLCTVTRLFHVEISHVEHRSRHTEDIGLFRGFKAAVGHGFFHHSEVLDVVKTVHRPLHSVH